jgi:hypothetical protein
MLKEEYKHKLIKGMSLYSHFKEDLICTCRSRNFIKKLSEKWLNPVINFTTYQVYGTISHSSLLQQKCSLMFHTPEVFLQSAANQTNIIIIIIIIIIVINYKRVYTRWQCATTQDRTIKYSTVQYNNTHHKKHTTLNTQGNSQYGNLQNQSRKHIIPY